MSSTVRRSIRRSTYLPVVLGCAAVALLAPAASASAAVPWAAPADTCAQVVVDGADVLGRATAVNRAADALAGEGATVRVRTYAEVPDGDLDAALTAEVSRCTGWQDADGERRPDLLVLAVSVGDRRIATSYGSRWSEALDPVWEGVQGDTMAPLMREDDHAGALAAGLDELRAAVAEDVPSADPDDGSYGGGTSGVEPYGPGPSFVDTQPGGGFGAASDGFVIVLIFGALAAVIAVVSALGGRGGGSSPSWGSSRSWSDRRHGRSFGSSSGSSFGSSSGSSFGSSSGSSFGSSSGSSDSSGSSGSSGSSDGGGGGSSSY